MPNALSPQDRERLLEQVRRLTRVMDSNFRVPGLGWRFGLDPLLGLVPGAGDAVSVAVSAYLILQARKLGLPKHVLVRMLGNVGLDALVGLVPLLGDVFDFAFKANRRNLRLMERHCRRLSPPMKTSARELPHLRPGGSERFQPGH